MTLIIRQSTQITVKVGPFLDATDAVTPETGLAGGGTEIAKNGGAYATGPTLGTHDAEGEYPVTLTTAHTDTVGRLRLKSFDAATHLPVWHEFQVIEESIFDALFGANATGLLPANVTQFGGVAATASGGRPEVNTTHAAGTAWASGAITAASIATGALTAAKFAAGAFDAVWTVGARSLTGFGTLIADIWANVTRTLTAGTKDAEIDDIKAKTDNLPAAPATEASAAAAAASAASAASDASAAAAAAGATAATIAAMVEDDGGTPRYTTNALEQAPAGGGGGGGLDAAGVRAAVGLASANLDTQLAGIDASVSGADLTVVSPVALDGQTLEIIQGDDYKAADARSLDWSSTSWPDFTGATTALRLDGVTDSIAGSIVNAGGSPQTLRFEIDAAASAALPRGDRGFAVVVTRGGNVLTEILGTASVRRAV